MELNRRAFMGSAVMAAGLAGCQTVPDEKTAMSPAVDRLQPLRDYMETHRATWGIPGMTLAVVTRDGFEGIATSGNADLERGIPVGPDHLFQIGSITKTFTGLSRLR